MYLCSRSLIGVVFLTWSRQEFFNFLGPVFGITAGWLKYVPIIAGSTISKEATGAIGTMLGAIGNGYITTVNYPADQNFNNLANLNQFMTNIFESARTNMQNMQYNLAPGKAWQGKFFK